MADPLSVVLIGAAAGGAAGGAATKFVEVTLTSGGRWIAEKFSNHNPKAIEKARENSSSFLNRLGEHLSSLEEGKILSSEQITSALESPDFSMALHNALLSAAQTESAEKHDYLSQLVVEHLGAKSESTLALASKSACTVVAQLTQNQLSLLGFIYAIRHIRPAPMAPETFANWLENFLKPYTGTACDTLDWQHLQALGCLQKTIFTSVLHQLFQELNPSGIAPQFYETDVFKHVTSIWDPAGTLTLTTIGQLIGSKVVSYKSGLSITLSDWGAT